MRRWEEVEGRGHLLEAWEVPPDSGGAIGCMATTFTFEAAFFEEQCLSRFLDLQTNPQEQTAAYLIEREERLAETYVGVLVDRRHAGAERSLRWDVLPIYVRGAAMHAKVSVLAWAACVRVIIGSANLTEVAYRKNLEVYGVLDFRNGGEAPLAELRKILDCLGDVLALTPENVAQTRTRRFIERVRESTADWREIRAARGDPRVAVVFGGRLGGRSSSVLQTLRNEVWPDASPPRWAWVVSPFFDTDAGNTGAALRDALAQRGEYKVTFGVDCGWESDGRLRIHAPKSLVRALPDAAFFPITEDSEIRPLHAKCMWLANDRWTIYMIGSSNFTQAGLGIGNDPQNVEANLAYLFPTDGKAHKVMAAAFPDLDDEVEDLDVVVWDPLFDRDADISTTPILPLAFEDAMFTPTDGGGTLTLTFQGMLPTHWWLRRCDGGGARFGRQCIESLLRVCT